MENEAKTTVAETTETVEADNTEKETAKTSEKTDSAELWKEITALKKRLSEVNSEAASYKKDNAALKGQLKAKMTEDERKEAERLEADKAKDEELATLRREKTVNGYKARLMEIGYDAETAATMADGLPADLSDEFFAAQKNFIENKTKQIQADLVKNQPNLSMGKPLAPADASKKADEELRGWFGLR